MSFLRGAKETKEPPDHGGKKGCEASSMIVGWSGDAGRLGDTVTDFVINKIGGSLFYEITPLKYFSLNGVAIEDDLVQFPESKFYACNRYNLVVFKSAPPVFDQYKFINQILDVAVRYCKVKDIYSIGGMASSSLHIVPRQLTGTFSSLEVKEDMKLYEIESNINYETPPGQKPALNSLLLWSAKKRNLRGINLWVTVPFYLMSVDDPKSEKRLLEFINQRFRLGINLSEIDNAIKWQNMRINDLRNLSPEIDDYLTRLEGNLRLSEDENLKLIKQVEEHLKREMHLLA